MNKRQFAQTSQSPSLGKLLSMPTNKAVATLFFTCLLSACGGGGGSSTESAQPQTQTTESAQDNKTTDTSLQNNDASNSANFEQFKKKAIEIDLDQYDFSADTIYAKVYIDAQTVLFLGKVDSNQRLKLHVPNNTTKVKFDLFSQQAGDDQVTGEIEL